MTLMHESDGALLPPLGGLRLTLAIAGGGGVSDKADCRLAYGWVEFGPDGRGTDIASEM
jgi:hypothetical protein